MTKLFFNGLPEIRGGTAVRILIAGFAMSAALIVPSIVVGQNAEAVAAEDGIAALCATDDDCEIPYDFLSSEETNPYLVSGEPPTKREDIRAARRWPDVRSCLVREERISEQSNISKLDWSRMRREVDIKVCLYRVASSIGKPERMEDWFRAQGMTDIRIKYFTFRRDEFVSVTANHNIKNTGLSYQSEYWPLSLLRVWTVYAENFGIVWTHEGALRGTSHDSTIL